jgi:hypothetical protein
MTCVIANVTNTDTLVTHHVARYGGGGVHVISRASTVHFVVYKARRPEFITGTHGL